MKRSLLVLVSAFIMLTCQEERTINFNEDIRPIFNEKCIGCHGGVKQAGGFGLVFRENALRETDNGKFAIVPGKPGQSEIIARVRHENEELRMPFEGPALSEEEIHLLETWIEEGAEWEEHWAYLAPTKPEIPVIEGGQPDNSIDAFVMAALLPYDLVPAPRAPKRELLRRVSFDLTGLPAPEFLAEVFLSGDLAYEVLIDSLLAQPSYGEHQAAKWLELARYADSRGYERDRPREIWRYRDWVIKAFNDDLPYDDFVTHQLAGDLLPDPTEDQLVATGFHRNTLSNGEGGTENEEFRVASVIDRVNTTWEVFQGTTMGCVQCHAHPYDPIRYEEFYTSYALFNNTVDHDHVSEAPRLRTLYAADEVKYKRLEDWVTEHAEEEARTQVQSWRQLIKVREPRLRPDLFENVEGGVFTARADEDIMFLRPGNSFALPPRDLSEVAALHVNLRPLGSGTLEVRLASPTGQLLITHAFERGRQEDIRLPLVIPGGERVLSIVTRGDGNGKILAIDAIGYEPKLPGAEQPGAEDIKTFIGDLLAAKDSVNTLIMVETTDESRRKSYLFERGNWMVHGPEVTGGVPKLLDGEADTPIENRLDFARWLTNPDQPLTSRVAVNRTWGQLFGIGLVATTEDIGSQGSKPKNQQLLDYLATEYSGPLGWSKKRLLRQIVLSNTYQQSSRATPQLLAKDPHNELLARGPRKRLTAEEIRDQALAVSGLLTEKCYGPSVMPPQPDGLWGTITHSRNEWVNSTGEDRYRRALYTHLRRSAIHPVMSTFDASNRELCLSRRTITNTPLQALMTLNDPAYLEVAERLADEVSNLPNVPARIDGLYELLLRRPAEPLEQQVLVQLYDDAYATHQDAHTALTVVANALLNIDELLTIS
ncbi:PSD1 and planctomycete cytochrome C domain-containing protein [Neolewinella antarctica]|uniref:Cytochrome c domain-containing protein n=1 Tax=Neolewinella antarctica TaxID=442734 RepID=A0ABX0X856_9BACT|nr:PSD1 and planctomycete cytochrome C domain-containing protein [Neolewinella antarctica]NJC25198.1 hypothetical protein [Neolewinella antarctica]